MAFLSQLAKQCRNIGGCNIDGRNIDGCNIDEFSVSTVCSVAFTAAAALRTLRLVLYNESSVHGVSCPRMNDSTALFDQWRLLCKHSTYCVCDTMGDVVSQNHVMKNMLD